MNIEQIEVVGKDYTRTTWFSAGPKQKHPLCVFLDGEHYLKSMNVLSILQELSPVAAFLICRLSLSLTMVPRLDMRITSAATDLLVTLLKI